MRAVDSSDLQPIPQDDIILIVRLLRGLVTNLRVYPEGHSIVQAVGGRVWERVASGLDASPKLLIGADTSLLTVNNDSIYKSCDEQAFSVELAAWLRERGVQNILMDQGATGDELLRLFSWLHGTPPQDVREATARGLPRDLALDKVEINVAAGKNEDEIRKTLETMDLAPIFEQAGFEGGSGNAEWTQTDLGRLAREGKLDDLVDGARMEEFVESFFAEQFDASKFTASRLAPADIDQILERLQENLGAAPSPQLDETIAAKAAEAVARMMPDLVGSYLATELPAGQGQASRVRIGVLEQLRGDSEQQGHVLGELSTHLGSATDASRGLGCLHAMEALVPQALAAGDRTAAFEAVGTIAVATLPGKPEELRARAKMSLRYLASPELIANLLHQLQTAPPTERQNTRDLLRVLGPYAVPTLMEEMRSSMRRAVRDELREVLIHVGRRALMDGDDPSLVLDPLFRELDNHAHNPWYFTRNVVAILGELGGPGFQKKLTNLLGEGVDPRIRTEAARALIKLNTDTAREVLGEVAFAGGLDPTGVAIVIPFLIRTDTGATLTSLQDMLSAKDCSAEQADATLSGLALDMDDKVLPLLRRVLSERSGLLKRFVFPEVVRLAAIDALGLIGGMEAAAKLSSMAEDKNPSLRRRATEVRSHDAAEFAERARQKLQISG
jgi:HEAT repeat protein